VPMIDVYAPAGVFDDKHQLARRLAAAVMLIEKVPDIAMFREKRRRSFTNCPATQLPMSTAGSDYVRVQVLLQSHKHLNGMVIG
jgi:hypothetical protein